MGEGRGWRYPHLPRKYWWVRACVGGAAGGATHTPPEMLERGAGVAQNPPVQKRWCVCVEGEEGGG